MLIHRTDIALHLEIDLVMTKTLLLRITHDADTTTIKEIRVPIALLTDRLTGMAPVTDIDHVHSQEISTILQNTNVPIDHHQLLNIKQNNKLNSSKTLPNSNQTEVPILHYVTITLNTTIEDDSRQFTAVLPFAVADIKHNILGTPFFEENIQNINLQDFTLQFKHQQYTLTIKNRHHTYRKITHTSLTFIELINTNTSKTLFFQECTLPNKEMLKYTFYNYTKKANLSYCSTYLFLY